MPLSHIGLTVSHLPTSTSFFLSALQPLGYRYIGQWGNQVGLGVYEADFFLTQETPGVKAGAAHIAFSAASRSAVKAFYTSALTAGGRPHGSPAYRDDGAECYNAAVLDFDGNSVEVVYHPQPTADDATMVTGQSRILTWTKAVAGKLESNRDAKSVISLNSVTSAAVSAAKNALIPTPAANSSASRSQAGSLASEARSNAGRSTVNKIAGSTLQRSLTEPILNALTSGDQKVEMSSKTLVGTILGAAAGAAVAYAMCKSEEDSAKAELEYAHAMAAESTSRRDSGVKLLDAPAEYSSQAGSRFSKEAESYNGGRSMRAIEAPPPRSTLSYQQPAYQTVIGTQAPQDVEYVSGGPRSRASMARSVSYPGPTRSMREATLAPEPRISEVPRVDLDQASSHHSHRSSRSHHSKSKSHVSERSSSSKKGRSRSQSGSRAGASKPRGGTSVLGRSVADLNPWEPVESSGNDTDTVLPSDSVSQAGARSRGPSSGRSKTPSSKHRSSHHSTSSKKSKSSKSKRRSSYDDSKIPVMKPDEIVEPGDDGKSISTMTPDKYREDSRRYSRKYATEGSVMSLPVRGITPSLIHGSKRSAVTYYG